MRFLPRFPLYAAAMVATGATVLLTAAPASAQFTTPVVEEDRQVPCTPPPDQREDLTSQSWTMDFIGVREAHQYNKGTFEDGTPVKIAVIDSGVQADLPIFGDRVLPGFDVWDPNSDGRCDGYRHGTGVAAIAAGGAQGDQFIGVAPEANILPVRAFVSDEGADFERSKVVAKLIDDAVRNEADVINVSIALPHTKELQDAVRNAIDANVVIVAATGNDTLNMDEESIPGKDATFYPANYPEVIAVGGHNLVGNWFEATNFGKNLDLLAPGVQVAFPYAGGGWITEQGTSYAAPHVAGAAALLKGYFGKDTTPQWIEQRLKDTAIHPANDDDIYLGSGVLNVVGALSEPVDEEEPQEPTAPPSFEPDSIDPIIVGYDPLRTEKIIAWSSVGASIVLIVLVLVFRKVIPQGRARRWKPGTRASDNLPVKASAEEHL